MRPLPRYSALALGLALVTAYCSSGTTPSNPGTIAKLNGDNQQGTVGAAVPVAPSVKITDQNNQGVSGVTVTFAVASGGGSLTGGTATTGNDGVATVGSWTLGTAVGTNTLSATSTGVTGSPVTFTATGAAGAPKTVTKQNGTDNQTANAGTAVAVKPAVKVVDQFNNPVSGVSVTFAVATGGGTVAGGTAVTGADGVATAGDWSMGMTAGANTLTATVTGAGITGNPVTFNATCVVPAFNPNANTSLGGTQTFSSVTIPAGVTVTMTGDLTLNVSGAVTINGNIVGDCLNLTINADGALAVSGNLKNGCSGAIPASGPPAMTLVGKGGYTFNGPGKFTAGGDVTITTDPTLTDANFAPPSASAPARASLRGKGGHVSVVGVPCVNNGYTGTAMPAHAQDGADLDPNGTDGKDASTWVLRCSGGSDIIISGSLSLTGQNGGRGGNGTNHSNTAAVSKGGKGGKGGTVKIQALGSISIGPGSTIKTGDGGVGGNAIADGSGGHGGAVGASANATGGAGAAPGLFSAVAKNGGIDITGSLNIQIGIGGKGGDGTATGGNGHDAPACPPAAGGPATATAGAGGSTPDKTLQAAGAVTGLGNVSVTGGTPGAGGAAKATAGNGGAGDQPCKPGAIGGDMNAKGGKGGDALVKDQTGTLIANGGNGGSMEDALGKGGQGWVDCKVIWEPGGPGGAGGNAAGSNGAGGTGLAQGTPGSTKLTTVSDGGNGGDGLGPGAGGAAGGAAGLNTSVVANVIQPSFVPGVPGNICIGTTVKTAIVQPPTQDQSGHESVLHEAGTYTVQLTIGSNTISINGLIKNSTIVLTGDRSGNNFTMTGAGVIHTSGNASGDRNATIQFTGSIGPNGLTGVLQIAIAGFPFPAIYPVIDP